LIMAVARKILPLLFVAALAGPYCRWLIGAVDKPLWGDELITVALVKSASFSHLLAAVLVGLDATPPLYTGMAGSYCISSCPMPLPRCCFA
jgi:hypothetical protein